MKTTILLTALTASVALGDVTERYYCFTNTIASPASYITIHDHPVILPEDFTNSIIIGTNRFHVVNETNVQCNFHPVWTNYWNRYEPVTNGMYRRIEEGGQIIGDYTCTTNITTKIERE